MINNDIGIKSIISIIFFIGLVSYTIAYTRRVLVTKYDERLIIFMESSLIFLFTMLFILVMSNCSSKSPFSLSKKSLVESFKGFNDFKDFRLLLLGSLAGALIPILWICVIRHNELSNMLLTKQTIDILFALGGSYLLLSEQITIKKLTAFVLLRTSVYLLSY